MYPVCGCTNKTIAHCVVCWSLVCERLRLGEHVIVVCHGRDLNRSGKEL